MDRNRTIAMSQTLLGILQYFGEMPPPYNPVYDMNADGYINIQDVLICLSYL